MSIAVLPQNTIRAIGSSQALTDAPSLVKELVENALDAKATAVFVEISINAVDVIQVKDDGHGIAPEDRPMVGRRYCTSKIRGLDDLSTIGGSSLGFRGEALASAAELSGALIIFTRVQGEPVAVLMKKGREGEILSEEHASNPPGTTVRVLDFLKDLPVRRQSALKAASKSAAKIRSTLQAFALARPSVRFSLKVLKAKNDKSDWVYAPKVGATVVDAALKVTSKAVVDECEWHVWPSSRDGDSATAGSGEYVIEALAAKRLCQITAINHVGQFMSVDSRPVSSTRTTMKEIIKLYKSCIPSAGGGSDGIKVVDPFLRMNIVCPLGSYDANVEPAKDDVLFSDSKRLLQVVRSFFKSIYGEPCPAAEQDAARTRRAPIPAAYTFDTLLARRPSLQPRPTNESNAKLGDTGMIPVPTVYISTQYTGQDRIDVAESTGEPGRQSLYGQPQALESICRPSMYTGADDDELISDCLDGQDLFVDEEEDPDGADGIGFSNPWTIAKMNAPVRHQSIALVSGNRPVAGSGLATPVKPHRPPQRHPELEPGSPSGYLPTPQTSNRKRPRLDHRLLGGNATPTHRGSLDRWMQTTDASQGDFVSAGSLPRGTPLSDIPDISSRLHKLQAQQRRQLKHTPPSSEAASRRYDAEMDQPPKRQQANAISRPAQFSETRKQNLPAPVSGAVRSPHRHRYDRAIATLGAPSGETHPSTLDAEDARLYLLRTQTEESAQAGAASLYGLKRRKTARLPLERIPQGHVVHDLRLSVGTTEQALCGQLALLRAHDGYARDGASQPSGLEWPVENPRRWQGRIADLLARRTGNDADGAALNLPGAL